MNIKLSGSGVEENKVAFDKLLAKWDELFTRETLFDEMKLVEVEEDGIVTFTNESTELSFYQTEAAKAKRVYISLTFEPVRNELEKYGEAFGLLFAGKTIHANNIEQRIKNTLKNHNIDFQAKEAVKITEIIYEMNAEKRISFVFSKFTGSNDVVLHIEFSDDSSDTELNAKVTAVSEEKSEITLSVLLTALGKEELCEHFDEFSQRIEENKKRLQETIQEKTKQEELEKLQPAFDSLDNL